MNLLILLLSIVTFAIPVEDTGCAENVVLEKRQRRGKGKAVNVNQLRNAGKGIPAAQARAGTQVTIIEGILQPSPDIPLSLQYRVAVPENATGTQGLNVLLHGDGGTSFFEFPNAALQDDLIGVAFLAPNPSMQWGGGDDLRSQGPQHVQMVRDFITNNLTSLVSFDRSKVYFTGVSGGALTLSSAMLPLFGDEFPSGMFLLCGGLPPPQAIAAGKLAPTMRIHFQTTVDELPPLKTEIPDAIRALSNAAQTLDITADQLNAQFTVDGTPQGGHCAFDGVGFNSGIQQMVDNFGNIMLRNQAIPGITSAQLQGITQLPNPF